MKRVILVIVLILSMTLTSCTRFLPLFESLVESDEEKSEKIVNEIIEVINSRDREELKKLFTDVAIQETDIEAGIDYLFDYLPDEEIIFIPDEEQPSVLRGGNTFGSTEDGKRLERITDEFLVTIGEESYVLYFLYYSINEKQEGMQGLHYLRITREEYIIENYTENEKFGKGDEAYYKEVTAYDACHNEVDAGVFVPDGIKTNYLGVIITE